ncbi:MAG: cobalt-zinc-cadmium resistance protein CzcA [Pseudoalteromonas tetraodonis]
MIHLQQAPFLAQLIVRYRLFAAAALIVLAAMAIWRIPYLHSGTFPDLSQTQVTVNTLAPGLAAEEVEQQITYPLEVRLKALGSVDKIRSTSSTGESQIVIIFGDDLGSQQARQLVAEQLQAAASSIPAEAQMPKIGADITALSEVYHYALHSTTHSGAELHTLNQHIATRILRPVPGVADVWVTGGEQLQYQVQLDASQLASHEITAAQVIEAIKQDNLNAGGGFVFLPESDGGSKRYTLRGIGRLDGGKAGAEQLGDIPVAWLNGAAITVSDLGTVKLRPSQLRSYASVSTQAAGQLGNVVSATVLLRSGADASTTLEQVKKLIPEIQKSLPEGVAFQALYDQGTLVSAISNTLFNALYASTALIAIVLLLFLFQIRATLLILLSIPVSVSITLLIFERIGMSTNLMSLGGLAIGIVALIDGSIVVMDSVIRKLAFSPSAKPRDVIADALTEVARPVLFAAFVVSTVFLPLLTMDGLGGKLFDPLAFAVVLAQICGLITALLILPAGAALVYKRPVKPRSNRPMQKMIQRYRRSLERVLNTHRGWIVGLVVVLLLLAMLTPHAGSEFIPELEEGSLSLQVKLPAGSDIQQAIELAPKLEKTLISFPEVLYSSSQISRNVDGTEITITMGLANTKSWTSAPNRSALTTVMGRKLAAFRSIEFRFSQPLAAGVDEMLSGTRAQIAVKIFGPSIADLQLLTKQAGNIIKSVPGTIGINLEEVPSEPRISIVPRRDVLLQQGITVAQVMKLVSDAFSEQVVGHILSNDQRIDIVVGLQASDKDSTQSIARLGLHNAEGNWIQLDNLVTITVHDGPAWIRHERGERRMVIGVNARSRDLSGLVGRLDQELTRRLNLPSGYRFVITGEHQDQKQSLTRLAWASAIAALVILIALRYSLGGFRQALLVMGIAPLAGIGGHFALAWSGLPLSVPAAIGYLAVAGLSILNGVVLIDAINQKREAGCTPYDAIIDGAAGRLRPVLITATTTVVGLLPLMFSDGPGAELLRPLATVMVGGLISATLLTLWVLPANYKWSTQTREAKAARQSLDV